MTKLYFTFFLFFIMAFSVHAQVDGDSKKKSLKLPPVTDSPNMPSTISEKPKEIENNKGIAAPKIIGELEMPKKEFSMFPQEQFGNPGELYTKRLDKLEEELVPEGYGSNGGLKEDAYWGDYKTTSNFVQILCRDYGAVDGDLLRIIVNDDVLQSNVLLTGGFKGFKLKLQNGFNKIDFYAVNEGTSLPNTAEYKIVDEQNKIISSKVWALSAGVKVTIIIIKE